MGGVPNFTFSLALGGSEKGRTTAHGLINCYSSSSVYSHLLKKKVHRYNNNRNLKKGKSELICMLQ